MLPIGSLFSGAIVELGKHLGHVPSETERLWHEGVRQQNEMFAEMGLPPHPAVGIPSFDTYERSAISVRIRLQARR